MDWIGDLGLRFASPQASSGGSFRADRESKLTRSCSKGALVVLVVARFVEGGGPGFLGGSIAKLVADAVNGNEEARFLAGGRHGVHCDRFYQF